MRGGFLPDDWYPGRLPENVVLGDGSSLYSRFSVIHSASRREDAVVLGRDSGVYNGSFFDLGPSGQVIVGDFVTVVGCIFATNSRVEIGSFTFISHEVVIADYPVAQPYRGNAEVAPDRSRDISIGPDAWIGLRAVILGGARLGRGTIVGAGAVVDSIVPDYAIVAGNPASVVGWAYPEEALK